MNSAEPLPSGLIAKTRQFTHLLQPDRILQAAILTCLFIFWLSMLLPRGDGHLIGSDGIFYYSYLPSVLLDGDFDFTDEFGVFFAQNPAERELWLGELNQTDKGVPGNQWSIGPAMLWAPFFLLAHVVALLASAIGFNVDTQGYGNLYQATVISANIIFAGIGLWYSYKLTARLINKRDALVATLLLLFAGNLIYYMTVEPLMAHSAVLMLVSLFFWRWYQADGALDAKTAAQLGALAGLMALIRPQAGLLLAVPFVMALPAQWHAIQSREAASVVRWLASALTAAGVAMIVFAPQLAVWNHMNGGFLNSGYASNGGQLFYWAQPKLWNTLFSSGRGLFVWHPVFLFAACGVGLLLKRQDVALRQPNSTLSADTFAHASFAPLVDGAQQFVTEQTAVSAESQPVESDTNWTYKMAAAGAISFLLQWYVISSWNNWWQGYAFGGRMFIVCTPFFVLGAAAAIRSLRQRVDWRILSGMALLLVGFNLLFVIQYRLVLFLHVVLPTWHDVTLRRVTFLLELFG